MQNIFILLLIIVSLNVCLSAASSSIPMIRSMDQLIANLGSITTKNSECNTIFDKVCPIGCNDRIGAEALLLDECGVCGGDGSTCSSGGGDDDGSCGSTCIGLVVGIPLGILFLVILAAGVLFFSGVAARRRRRRNRNTLPQRNATGQIANEHYSTPIRQQHQTSSVPTYAHQKHSKVTMTNKKRTSKIRWTNGKGNKYY